MFRPRVLIINDHPTHQMLASLMCQRHGVIPVVVAEPENAVREFEKNPNYAAVIIDLGLPEDPEARKCLHDLIGARRKRRVNVPMIALTAHAMDADRITCLQLGADDYLSKPYSSQQFGELLRRWIGDESDRRIKRAS